MTNHGYPVLGLIGFAECSLHLDLAKYVKRGWVNHVEYIVVGLGLKKSGFESRSGIYICAIYSK